MSTVFCLAGERPHSFVTIVMWGSFFWRWMALLYEDLVFCSRRTLGMCLSEPFKNGGVTDVAVFVQPPHPLPVRKGAARFYRMSHNKTGQNDGAREDRSSAVSETVDAGIWKSRKPISPRRKKN